MENISSISPIIPNYDAFILDLWGVVHDGSQLYPGVLNTLKEIRKNGKKVIFLSNAPRRASSVAAVLTQLGIGQEMYDHIVSSGEVGYHWLRTGSAPWGKRYYLIAAQKDAGLLDDLDFEEVAAIENADFILNLGFGTDEQTTEDFYPVLKEAFKCSLPMLCLNPDLEVVKITGERYPCAGAIAKSYVALGGKVEWFGKPYIGVYDHAYKLFENIDKKKILAVGDSLETDIPGAKNFALDSALVAGGILKDRSDREIIETCRKLELNPKYIIPNFGS